MVDELTEKSRRAQEKKLFQFNCGHHNYQLTALGLNPDFRGEMTETNPNAKILYFVKYVRRF
jgi:hypothetical protein